MSGKPLLTLDMIYLLEDLKHSLDDSLKIRMEKDLRINTRNFVRDIRHSYNNMLISFLILSP